jgi:hypothetical protein
MASMGRAAAKTNGSTKPAHYKPRTHLFTIVHRCKKPLTEQKNSHLTHETSSFVLQKHNATQICTILHNLHNFRTILLKRQWVALLESKQIQAQKDGFPHFVHK